jgi:hypothetical protein
MCGNFYLQNWRGTWKFSAEKFWKKILDNFPRKKGMYEKTSPETFSAETEFHNIDPWPSLSRMLRR